MKTKDDPRHKKRISIVQKLFSYSFRTDKIDKEITSIIDHLVTVDAAIQKAAPAWPLEKISKVDLAILRLGTYELLIDKSEPEKVIIDEAVEIAKELGTENSSSFINGVLGTIIR